VYAAFAVISVLAAIGFVVGGNDAGAARTRLAWFFAGGVFLTLAPILYTNVMIDRIVVGRWMLPSLAPIMIALVVGLRAFIRAARVRPRRVATLVAAIGGALALIWMSPLGARVRDGIHRYHYGDQDHLIRVVTASIVGLVIAAACVEIAARLRGGQAARSNRVEAPTGMLTTWTIFGGMMALNLTLLFTFVKPLYRPFDDREFADAVRAEAGAGEFDRAAALLRLAQRAYPESTPLARIPVEIPLIPLRGGSDQLLADFEARLGRGQALVNREEIMALARAVPRAGRFEPDALRDALARAPDTPDLREALALVRAEMEGGQRDGSAAADVIRAAGGTMTHAEIPGVATIDGLTTYRRPEGGLELRVYFRPRCEWTRMKLLVFGTPADSAGGLTPVNPSVPLFNGWRTGELAWEVFTLSFGTWHVWTAVEIEGHPPSFNDGIDLGVIGR
jgi:hypothetical protein